MTTFKASIRRHPVVAYFALTCAISWGGLFILGAPHGMPTTNDQFQTLWPIVFLPYFLGPTIAGFLLTGLFYGKEGFRELLSRLLRWRVGARWYTVALLVVARPRKRSENDLTYMHKRCILRHIIEMR